MSFHFDDKNHIYTLNGRQLPSVTTMLKDVGFIDDRYFNEYAAKRGTYVHKATALWDKGNLDESSLDIKLNGYLNGYKLFRKEFKVEWTHIETPFYNEIFDIAGIPDRVGEHIIVDIKTGETPPNLAAATPVHWHRIQTALYCILIGHDFRTRRFGLYLKSSGSYKLVPFTDRKDFEIAHAVITVYHAKNRA